MYLDILGHECDGQTDRQMVIQTEWHAIARSNIDAG